MNGDPPLERLEAGDLLGKVGGVQPAAPCTAGLPLCLLRVLLSLRALLSALGRLAHLFLRPRGILDGLPGSSHPEAAVAGLLQEHGLDAYVLPVVPTVGRQGGLWGGWPRSL